ncbi:PorV/PorQ family protein [Elusimicrobiota bacterium]
MSRFRTFILFISTICFSMSGADAGIFTKDKIGTTSAQFLKLGIGARPVAMGEAFAGLADDVNAIYWNPAGLNLIDGRQISAMHSIWFEEIAFSWAGYTQKAYNGTIGIAVNYLTAGTMDSYDNTGEALDETYTAYDLAFTCAYAREISEIPLGISLKIINSKIEDESAIGIAADIGALKTISESRNIKAGLVIQNLGSGLKFIDTRDPLPLNIKIGSYMNMLEEDLLLTCDVNFPIDNQINAHIGAEYRYDIGDVSLYPRIGYKTNTINDLDSLSGLSAGFGVFYSNISLDYAWVPYWEFGSTHRVSANFKFGN